MITRVYSYAAYRLGPGADAEDVTSETMERALRYRDSYDPSRGQPSTWLLSIARRVIVEHLAVAAPHAKDDELQGHDSGEDVAGESVRRLSLAAAIETLAERDRELLSLRYGADLKAREIGELMQMETHAVEVALARALERLRAVFPL